MMNDGPSYVILKRDATVKFLQMLSEFIGIEYVPDDWPKSEVENIGWLVYSLQDAVTLGSENSMWEYEEADDVYVDLSVKKSELYLHWFQRFDRIMEEFGRAEFDGEPPGNVEYWYGCPWDDTGDLFPKEESGFTIQKLKETNDFFWFLVVSIQRFGSVVDYPMSTVKEALTSFAKDHPSELNFGVFQPLKTYQIRQSFLGEDGKITKKAVESMPVLKSFDFSDIEPEDSSAIPEYEIDEFFEYNGEYYSPESVFLAITAAGGMAQSLERQDLEGTVTTVNYINELKKKKYKDATKKIEEDEEEDGDEREEDKGRD